MELVVATGMKSDATGLSFGELRSTLLPSQDRSNVLGVMVAPELSDPGECVLGRYIEEVVAANSELLSLK